MSLADEAVSTVIEKRLAPFVKRGWPLKRVQPCAFRLAKISKLLRPNSTPQKSHSSH